MSVAWLAQEVKTGKIRWVLAEAQGGGAGVGRGLPGDPRAGAKAAIAAVEKGCQRVMLTSAGSGTSTIDVSAATGVSTATLYDCQGRSARL